MQLGNIPSAGIENELLTHGSYATNTNGLSMYPLFKTHRDVVVINKAEGELKKYDVVLYRCVGHENIFVLHRIVGKRENEYIIRGDNTFYTEYVPKDKILGVMVSFNRNGKRCTVNAFGYRLYSRFWVLIYPLRLVFKKIKSFAGKVLRRLFKRNQKNNKK